MSKSVDKAKLTPLERGVLLVLMAAGGPLRQNADIIEKYGLSVKASHRAKLTTLGLVRVTTKPKITLELTDEGWAWARQEVLARPPTGLMGLGTLYAVLNGLGRVLEGKSPRSFFENTTDNGSERALDVDIAEAAWSEADETLALAIQDLPTFGRVLAKHRDAASGEMLQSLEQIRLASDLVFQHVRLAAVRRGLEAKYERSQRTSFDPVEFDCYDDDLKEGARVEVLKSPIVKEVAGQAMVVVRGLAEAVTEE
jgi:hypothetical protein